MKKSTGLLAASLVMLLGSTGAQAQDGPPSWSPLEIYGCNFVDDADMDDLNRVIDTWNEWMDEDGVNDYAAILLSPFFTAASFPFDVLWVGIWENGAALSSLQRWLSEGGDVQDDFADVVDCPLHLGMAMNNIKPPGEPNGIVPVEFSDCKVSDGRIGPEGRNALVEWSEFLTENGSDAGHWILRPGVGEEADADYTFKWVTAYSSYESVGHDFELFFNGGGVQRFTELTGRVMSCDSPRMYNSRVVRQIADE